MILLRSIRRRLGWIIQNCRSCVLLKTVLTLVARPEMTPSQWFLVLCDALVLTSSARCVLK